MTPERAERAVAEWRERLSRDVLDVVVTSAATGQGLEELRRALVSAVPPDPEPTRLATRWRPRWPPPTASTGPARPRR